jgi:hypothetical protein
MSNSCAASVLTAVSASACVVKIKRIAPSLADFLLLPFMIDSLTPLSLGSILQYKYAASVISVVPRGLTLFRKCTAMSRRSEVQAWSIRLFPRYNVDRTIRSTTALKSISSLTSQVHVVPAIFKILSVLSYPRRSNPVPPRVVTARTCQTAQSGTIGSSPYAVITKRINIAWDGH